MQATGKTHRNVAPCVARHVVASLHLGSCDLLVVQPRPPLSRLSPCDLQAPVPWTSFWMQLRGGEAAHASSCLSIPNTSDTFTPERIIEIALTASASAASSIRATLSWSEEVATSCLVPLTSPLKVSMVGCDVDADATHPKCTRPKIESIPRHRLTISAGRNAGDAVGWLKLAWQWLWRPRLDPMTMIGVPHG